MIVLAVLGALTAVLGMFAPSAAMADTSPTASVGKISYTSHYWPYTVYSSSGMTSAWQSASASYPYWGYCNGGVTPLSLNGLSNQSLCGSNSSIISHVVVPFTTTAAGSWHFEVGPDYGHGSEMVVDGAVVSTRWYDIYSSGNLDNTGEILDATVTLPAGAHTMEIYGAEPCCDGQWAGRYQLAGAPSWTALSTSPPQVTVTGLGATSSLEYGSAAPTCVVTDAFDGTLTRSATLSAISGPDAANGIGSRTATCTYTDSRGLTGTASATYAIVDTTAPVISGVPANQSAEATGPAGATVTYTAPTALDAVDGAVSATCDHASGDVFPLGATTVTCTATDNSANTATTSFTVTVVDTTAPAITVPGNLTATATTTAGASVQFTATAADLVDGTVPVTCDHASGDTFALGATTVTCTSTDAHQNARTKSFTVTVTYSWSGVLSPVTAGGAYHLGRTLPIQFTLTGASAPVTNAVAKLYLTKLSGTNAGAEFAAPSTSSAVGDNSFRYDGTGYIFNLATKGLSAGSYQLRVDLGDGVSHTLNIILS